ncbi:MAG: hypothetical protein AAB316_08410, partial [Bacteroidota bacterium]
LRYVYEELAWLYEMPDLEKTTHLAEAPLTPTENSGAAARETAGQKNTNNEQKQELPGSATTIFEPEPPDEEPPRQRLGEKKFLHLYLHPTTPEISEKIKQSGAGAASRFLLTEDYMPVSYREMAQCWRYLRKKEEFRPGRQMDVEATVKQVAREGILLHPVFFQEAINSEDLLLILADRRGSMTPFHRLTDRLVEAARKEGGHRKAQVYYFYNCPAGHVYKHPNLIDPVPLSEVYHSIHPDRTNALVISDAGAARNNWNEKRLEKTLEFLNGSPAGNGMDSLHKRAHFVAWLNPMPRHRWAGTTAEGIVREGSTPMFPLLEMGKAGLLQAVHALRGR